jgi:Uma2 family endonuclease
MGMPHTAERWTAEMVRALPDDRNRYEVIDGELLVTPAPSAPHQRAVSLLLFRLMTYLQGQTWAEVLTSPADISFHQDMLVQPDVFVIPLGPGGRRGPHWTDIRALLLAVEVLSPSTARSDRQVKRRLYQREGVGEYWIVDLDARVVERWRPADERPEIISGMLTWRPEAAAAPFELDLAEFFDDVLRESVG